MATYVNARGYAGGTSSADTFLFNTLLERWATVDALEGYDRLVFQTSSTKRTSFRAGDIFNTGVFYGAVDVGSYEPTLTFYNVEDVDFVGSSLDDGFRLEIANASSGLVVNFDGGDGTDFLEFDFSRMTSSVDFRADGGTIVSSFGAFAEFEVFAIRGGSGSDTIHTSNGDDSIYSGTGSDVVSSGAGNDTIYTESGGDTVDGGAGYDYWTGNYGGSTEALTIDVGQTVTASNGATAINVESVTVGGGSGDDQINVTRGGSMSIYGGSGYDKLTVSASIVQPQKFTVVGTFVGLQGSVDQMGFQEVEEVVFKGGSLADVFEILGLFAPASIHLDGGAGVDELRARFEVLAGVSSFVVATDGTVSSNRGEFVGFEAFMLNGGADADVFTTGSGNDLLGGGDGNDRLQAGGGRDTLVGNAGDDQLSGGSGDDTLYGDGGNDTLSGDAGNDEMNGGEGADALFGGTGDDRYIVTGATDAVTEYAGEGIDAVVVSIANYTLPDHVENLEYSSDSYSANPDTALRGNALDNRIVGGRGNDSVEGFAGNDQFLLMNGGDDRGVGGAGDDGFYFGGALTEADRADGGEGSDQLGLQGRYDGLVLGAGLVGIETLVLLSGSDMRFGNTQNNVYDYGLTSVDANVAAGMVLTVNMNMLRVGEDVRFDGSAEADGSFLFFGGAGAEMLTGGARSDAFYFGTGLFGSGDRLMDGGGGDDQVGLQGDYAGANALAIGAAQLSGIETIVALSGADRRFGGGGGGASFSYDLTLNDGNTAAGAMLTVNGNALTAGETLRVNATAETDGVIRIFGGSGADVLTGGGGADRILGGASDDRITGGIGADTLSGGAGNDLFAYRSIDDSKAGARDMIADFAAGDRIDLSGNDANMRSGGDDAFRFIGVASFSGSAGELRSYAAGVDAFVEGDVDGDGVGDFLIVVSTNGPSPALGDFIL